MKRVNSKKLKYLLENWKICAHLLLQTTHFGVLNKWWHHEVTIFHKPFLSLRRWNVVDNYRQARFKASIGFLPLEEYELLFTEPWFIIV